MYSSYSVEGVPGTAVCRPQRRLGLRVPCEGSPLPRRWGTPLPPAAWGGGPRRSLGAGGGTGPRPLWFVRSLSRYIPRFRRRVRGIVLHTPRRRKVALFPSAGSWQQICKYAPPPKNSSSGSGHWKKLLGGTAEGGGGHNLHREKMCKNVQTCRFGILSKSSFCVQKKMHRNLNTIFYKSHT